MGAEPFTPSVNGDGLGDGGPLSRLELGGNPLREYLSRSDSFMISRFSEEVGMWGEFDS